MLKYKLTKQAVDRYFAEMELLKKEKRLLEQKEDICFDRFLARCHQINESTFLERWHESCDQPESDDGE